MLWITVVFLKLNKFQIQVKLQFSISSYSIARIMSRRIINNIIMVANRTCQWKAREARVISAQILNFLSIAANKMTRIMSS